MIWYVLKLLVLLPLIGGLIWGSLILAKRLQGFSHRAGRTEPCARLDDVIVLAPGIKLAVIEFAGRRILVSTSKNGLTRLAETDALELPR